MTELSSTSCEPCRKGAPLATAEEISLFMRQLPDWQVGRADGVDQLSRSFAFKNFSQALEFTNRVGKLAEVEGHHPAILTEWGRVTVSWWTHKIGGLHRNDFVMAAKTDRLL